MVEIAASPSRKRILFLVPAFPGGVGGAERVISTLLCHFDHSRFECHLALVQAGRAYLENVPPAVTIHQLRRSRMRYALPGIIRLVWRIRPRTILSTVSYLNVMLAGARPLLPRGVRLILREATTPSAFIQKETTHPRLWSWLYRHLYPRADKIICLSDSMVEDMALHFGIAREKLVRIYNPVDTERLRQLAAARPNPYQGNGPHLVVAGRLRKEKGFDLLLDAMPAVLLRFPSVRLTILGEGHDQIKLKAQAAQLGIAQQVNFLGFQQNPWPYFGNADLFILPSRLEGMPNALLECLALERPVIAADCPGGIREIQQAVGSINLVPAEDSAALADAIISALCKPPECRRKPAGAALDKFNPQQIAAEYSKLL